ncbi:NUDIX domain-containing protein [Tateyamaria sp. SN6-1]|uniref:NUDIX domain-containing protein n=1 Tax=Tateyamaria sp. SN6-1 TaxID=3092148 RepID=UPI0039F5ACFF
MRQVACPVALHPDGAVRRIPVFEHPQAGLQLVKGGVEPEERPERAAARELFEEAGLETRAALLLGQSDDIVTGERWHFALCRIVPPVRDRWQHLCADDGGHLLRFSWVALDAPAPEAFALKYTRAFDWIRTAL